MISFDEFSKVELRVGTILSAEEVLGSEKLIKLMVDLGEDEPRMMMGLESNGMLLAADATSRKLRGTRPIPLKPSSKVTTR